MLKHKRSSIEMKESSIVLDLMPVFKSRNIKFPAQFLKRFGICSASASKMIKGKAVQINFTQLTAICVNLNCTPNDIMALRYLPIPENHALKVIRKLESHEEFKSIDEWAMGKSFEEVREIMRK